MAAKRPAKPGKPAKPGSTPPPGSNNQTPRGGSTNIGPTRDADAATLNPAAVAQSAQLNPAAQSQGAQLDLTNDNQFRGNQQSLISQLQAQANGTGPSIANAQFKAATDQNIAQQSALAAGARGSGAGLVGRQAMINSAGLNQGLAQQSAIQRMTEQLNAQNQLGGVINQGRTADQSVAGQNANLTQNNSQFNATQGNDINKAQGTLQNQVNLQNATQADTINQNQGTLTNATNLANAGATNQARIAQAQVNQAGNTASKYASAQIGAAGEAAGASKYATDAANARLTEQLINQNDNTQNPT